MRTWVPLTVVMVVQAGPALAGRGKILEIKGAPRTVAGLAEALQKEKKDPLRRSALSLTLDDLLRAAPEVSDPSLYDQLAGSLFNDVLDRVCEPTETWSTEYGPEKFNPRADFFFKEEVKVRPGRVSKTFRRRFTKKPAGKNIDRGYRNQPLTVSFVAAASDDELSQWTDVKGWGALVHAAHVDVTAGVARIGLTLISPGTKDAPGARFERPSWVAFYRQPRPGVGAFQLLGLESVTATDWREQPLNVLPPKIEPNDAARRLNLAVWMEQVRALPPRAAFAGQEEALFNLDYESADKLDPAQVAWLERYRDSDSPLVRAAAELKVAEWAGAWKPDNVWSILKGVTHPVVKARLEELLKKAPPDWKPPGAPGPASAPAGSADGGK